MHFINLQKDFLEKNGVIKITDNLFAEDEINLILEHNSEMEQDRTNSRSWKNHPLTDYAETDVGRAIRLDPRFSSEDKGVIDLITDRLELDYPKIRVAYYYNSPGWKFKLHPDHNRDFSASIYLNDNWDNDEYGGEFIWLDDNKNEHTVNVKFNRMVSFYPPVWHYTNTIKEGAPVRKSIQVFCEE